MDRAGRNADLTMTAVQMLFGAGEIIALKARYVDGREFGFQLEDLAYSIDNRLELRCLLPLPGLIRLRDGSLREERQPEQSELDALKKSLAVLEDAGWQA